MGMIIIKIKRSIGSSIRLSEFPLTVCVCQIVLVPKCSLILWEVVFNGLNSILCSCLGSCCMSVRGPGTCLWLTCWTVWSYPITLHIFTPATERLNLLDALSQTWYKVKNNSLTHYKSWYLVRKEGCGILRLRLNKSMSCSFHQIIGQWLKKPSPVLVYIINWTCDQFAEPRGNLNSQSILYVATKKCYLLGVCFHLT